MAPQIVARHSEPLVTVGLFPRSGAAKTDTYKHYRSLVTAPLAPKKRDALQPAIHRSEQRLHERIQSRHLLGQSVWVGAAVHHEQACVSQYNESLTLILKCL